MYTRILIGFIALTFSFESFSQKPYEDYKVDSTLHGKVKSIKEKLKVLDKDYRFTDFDDPLHVYWFYSYSAGSEEYARRKFDAKWYCSPRTTYINNHKKFNRNGLLVSKTWTDEFGDIVSEYSYEYNKQNINNLIRLVETYGNDEYHKRNYNYNKNNDVVSSITVSGYKEDKKDDYFYGYAYNLLTYDNSSKLIETSYFTEEHKQEGSKYTYDSDGRLKSVIKVDQYRGEKEVDIIDHENIYDERGNLVQINYYDTSISAKELGKLRAKSLKTYENNLIVKDVYISEEKNVTKTYSYDNLGRKIRETLNSNEPLNTHIILEYDFNNQNHITKLKYTKNDKTSIVDFVYTYDRYNNWTKQVKSVNGKEMFILTRKITYFK